jgi:DDE superfamily endonuclease
VDRQSGPGVCPKKGARDRLIRWAAKKPKWVLGYQDECWWSRVSDPELHSWREEDRPLRLRQKGDALPEGERKALSCYGLWLPAWERMLLRFVEERPVSAVTELFLEWVSEELSRDGARVLLLVWDNASWHGSRRVRAWLREHNRQVKRGEKEGVRLVVCFLPSKSPWLNPIEPKWLHGKRAVAEPDAVLDEVELMARVYEHFDCPATPLLSTTFS